MTTRHMLPTVDTPALLVDVDRLDRNITRMSAHATRAGLALRPHAKTHKSAQVARQQLAAGAVGITVAKPQEALTFWRAGIGPIFLAYPLVGPLKLAALQPMFAAGDLIVGLDDMATAAPLGMLAEQLGVRVPVMVEVDVGMHRVGADWGDAAARVGLGVARAPGLELRGIFCHEGHAHGVPREAMAGFTAEVAARMRQTADLIRAAGEPCPVVSVGSTLTVAHVGGDQGITEVRPGTYVFNDVRTVLDGGASWEDCAVSVLATVVSRPEPGRAVIDAGSKIFTPTSDERYGYGAVLDVPGAHLARLSEEHGVLELRQPEVDLRIGDRIRVVPIHVCVTINMQRELIQVRDGDIVGTLTVDAALCSQ
jgi:D-serine deaminase-like pyridoxal phosphate-dependent protein